MAHFLMAARGMLSKWCRLTTGKLCTEYPCPTRHRRHLLLSNLLVNMHAAFDGTRRQSCLLFYAVAGGRSAACVVFDSLQLFWCAHHCQRAERFPNALLIRFDRQYGLAGCDCWADHNQNAVDLSRERRPQCPHLFFCFSTATPPPAPPLH